MQLLIDSCKTTNQMLERGKKKEKPLHGVYVLLVPRQIDIVSLIIMNLAFVVGLVVFNSN